MSDPFSNTGGSSFGNSEEVPLIHTVSPSREASERAISAYRHNIALPDVHVADRHQEYVPVVVGEDGQELTPERRRQLMEQAGVQPMFDEHGKPTGQTYVVMGDEGASSPFDEHIEPERIGLSAERNRPNPRVVRPREFDIRADIDEDTVRSAAGETHVPGVQDAQMGARGLLYVGYPVRSIQLAGSLKKAMKAIYDASGNRKAGPKEVHVAHKTLDRFLAAFSRYALSPDTSQLFGCHVIPMEVEDVFRFYGDPAYTGASYSEIHLDQLLNSHQEKTDA